jgi:hypothetical protein
MARKNSNLITSVSATIADRSIGIEKLTVGRRTLNAGETVIANLDTIQTVDDFTEVYKNGVLLKNTTDYTIDSDNGIILTSAADANDEITIRSMVDNIAAAVPDGSVTSAKIASEAVTSAKIDSTVASTGKAIAMAIVFGG